MNSATYVIPTTLTRGKLPMEYRMETRRIDRRTRFERFNHAYKLSDLHAFYGLVGDCEMIIKADRIIAPDGKTAHVFWKQMQSLWTA